MKKKKSIYLAQSYKYRYLKIIRPVTRRGEKRGEKSWRESEKSEIHRGHDEKVV